MKLALITDPRGFPTVDMYRLSYHLVLAQYALEGVAYYTYYRGRHDQGDFIMMDNGAAEDGTLTIEELVEAAERVNADEIILPDVLFDSEKTIAATMNGRVLSAIPPIKRAIAPQGDSFDEWFNCANFFVQNLEFKTMCIPKHTERFPGGRVAILETIYKMHWHKYYNIHLLGIWGDPYHEPKRLAEVAPWVRGIDTAAPFALAQHNIILTPNGVGHFSHSWGTTFNRTAIKKNVEVLLKVVQGYSL